MTVKAWPPGGMLTASGTAAPDKDARGPFRIFN
jgi:hypothetical protein